MSVTVDTREELRLLLVESGILRAGADQPIQSREGVSAPWMFYSWGTTLTCRGLELAGQVLLERLKGFQATQIATIGYTAMPLLSSCILQGHGVYSGLSVREERKAYGSMRRIDGRGDKSRRVVVLDDSLVSGNSMMKAIQALEEEGFTVEGGLALVLFPWRGGLEFLRSLGYKMETIYDVFDDLRQAPERWKPLYQYALPKEWGARKIEAGLHPAVAARRAAELFIESGEVATPPDHLDTQVDARGGTFVSFRDRNTDSRLTREGFWHFQPDDADPPRDLVLATVQALRRSPRPVTREMLDNLKICVSFFGPLEKIKPAQLDFSQYGIVVRSQVVDKMGGALPNTQVFLTEVEQYRHARLTNAAIGLYEPHDLFRHSIEKFVEPGQYWLPFGFPEKPEEDWSRRDKIGAALTERAREYLIAAESGGEPGGQPLPLDLVPAPMYTVAVSIYHQGTIGCGVCWAADLDTCVGEAARYAWRDRRFREDRNNLSAGEVGVSVAILHDREWHDQCTVQYATGKLRIGLDSISVSQGNRGAIFIPPVAVYYNWKKAQVGQELMLKAGIDKNRPEPIHWATYPTATWLRRGKRVWRLAGGFPDRSQVPYPESQVSEDIRMLANYIHRHLCADGLPDYCYLPITGQRIQAGSAPRRIHGLVALYQAALVLREAEWQEAAERGLQMCRDQIQVRDGLGTYGAPGQPPSEIGDAVLLATLAEVPQLHNDCYRAMWRRLVGLLRPDGRIIDRPNHHGFRADHDFMPGAVLVALARATQASSDHPLPSLSAQLEWYRRRFRLSHGWGMVGWQTQGWNAIHALTGDPGGRDFTFELADWAMGYQQETHGFFLDELDPDGPSFHTGFVAEGIADAWALAVRVGDVPRAQRYRRSCLEACRFVNRLILRPEDTFVTADPHLAVGGVRGALARSDVRIDYVSHVLIALVKIQKVLEIVGNL